MTTDNLTRNRMATLVAFVSASPAQTLGRTAIVKFMYFLQELYGVRLGYDFRLYTYGPFDAGVLADLDTATTFRALDEKTVTYSNGYGYEIKPGREAQAFKNAATDWLEAIQSEINRVVEEFGSWSASDLELASTIIFVDRELKAQNQSATPNALASKVRTIKRHFSEETILAKVSRFQEKGWLESVTSGR